MGWLLFGCGEDVCAKHVKFLLIRERKDVNRGWVEVVVGDVDQPGAEEASPANCQHDSDMVRGQVMVIAVNILHFDFFSDIQSSMD